MRLGKYRHYKTQVDGPHCYEVLMVAMREGDREPMVVYRSCQISSAGDPVGTVWVRPQKEFLETVGYEGRELPRFEYVGS